MPSIMLDARDPESNEIQPCSQSHGGKYSGTSQQPWAVSRGWDMTPKPAWRNQDRCLQSGDRDAVFQEEEVIQTHRVSPVFTMTLL